MNKCQIKINKPLYLCENSPWFVFLLEGISWRILQAWNFNDLLEFSYFQTSMYVHQVLKRVKTSLKGQCKLRVYIIRKCIYVPFPIFYLFFFAFLPHNSTKLFKQRTTNNSKGGFFSEDLILLVISSNFGTKSLPTKLFSKS